MSAAPAPSIGVPHQTTVQTTNYSATYDTTTAGHTGHHYAGTGHNDSRYRCCCNSMHVERGAYVIAFIGAIMSAIFGILNLLSGNIVLFIVAIFFFLIYWSILAAQRKRHPNLYIPFLVMNWIAAVLLALYIIFLVLMLILLPDFWVRQHRDEGLGFYGPTEHMLWTQDSSTHRTMAATDDRGHPRYFWGAVRMFTWLQLIYSVVAEILTIYFLYVVYRAWQYMRGERQTPAVARGAAPAYKV